MHDKNNVCKKEPEMSFLASISSLLVILSGLGDLIGLILHILKYNDDNLL